MTRTQKDAPLDSFHRGYDLTLAEIFGEKLFLLVGGGWVCVGVRSVGQSLRTCGRGDECGSRLSRWAFWEDDFFWVIYDGNFRMGVIAGWREDEVVVLLLVYVLMVGFLIQ